MMSDRGVATRVGDGCHCSFCRTHRSARMPPTRCLPTATPLPFVKDLKVKGAGQSLKQGTVIKSIRLTDNPDEIDCRHDAIKGWCCEPSSYASADQAAVSGAPQVRWQSGTQHLDCSVLPC